MNELIIAIFSFFFVLSIISALISIMQNNLVYCIFLLIVTFVSTAVLWLITGSELLSFILILVYVGAIMTLFIFIIITTNMNNDELKKIKYFKYCIFSTIISMLLAFSIFTIIPKNILNSRIQNHIYYFYNTNTDTKIKKLTDSEYIGILLYEKYIFDTEITAIILLVSIISIIPLIHRKTRNAKYQNIFKQTIVNKNDRIKLINIK